MAKQTGLGAGLLVGGYDISGDIGALSRIACPRSVLDVTDITQEAFERRLALKDGGIDFSAYFNPATARAHPVLSALPRTDTVVTYLHRRNLQDTPVACMVGKQLNYDGSRNQDGSYLFSVATVSNAYGLEWGSSLTAGLRTDTGATSGTASTFNVGEPFLSLPGSSGNYANTPDAAALDITGDIDIRAKIAPDDWTPAANQRIVAKHVATGNQRSYLFSLLTTGALSLSWWTDGSTMVTTTSSANLSSLTNGTRKWVRATLDVDNGASNAAANFYTSDDGVTWTQLGTTQLTGATTSIFASTSTLELGSRDGGTDGLFAGKIYEAVVMNGIAGSEVAHPVATLSGITDATGRVWTVQGTAFLSIDTAHGLQAYMQVTAFTGTDATIKLQHSRDNSTWTDVTGGAFAAVTGAPDSERIQTSRTLPIERYLRVTTTTSAGFTSLSFVVAVVKNLNLVNF